MKNNLFPRSWCVDFSESRRRMGLLPYCVWMRDSNGTWSIASRFYKTRGWAQKKLHALVELFGGDIVCPLVMKTETKGKIEK